MARCVHNDANDLKDPDDAAYLETRTSVNCTGDTGDVGNINDSW